MTNDSFIQQALADLDSANPARRVEALQRLHGRKDVRIALKLIPLLHDPIAQIRRLAIDVLGSNPDSGVVEALIDVVTNDKDSAVRRAALQALRVIGTPEVLAVLQKLREQGALDEIEPLASPPPQRQQKQQQQQQQESEYSDETPRGIPPDQLREYSEAAEPGEEVLRPPAASADAAKEAAAPNPVQFSAYSPREIQPNVWQPLRAYIFLASAADAVAADAQQQLGAQFADYREVGRPALGSIAPGALITATPELTGFQFNPPSAQIAFYDPFERFDFKLRAADAPLDQASNGRITFTVEGVIVADIPLSIYVGASAPANAPTLSAPLPIYPAIFCSYSRKDTQIVEHVERAYKALGMDFLRDVETLKSGQDWSKELPELIKKANIFQLFWSNDSAMSDAVRTEWEFALSLKRQDQGFIRPVYWQTPMPAVPPELSPINFAYAPDLCQP